MTPVRDERIATRASAIEHHHAEADRFVRLYDEMARSRFANAFAYGRAKIDRLLDGCFKTLQPGARILDVGCGTGGLMLAIKKCLPGADIEGVEPSWINAQLARDAGFEVHTMAIGEGGGLRKRYDLIYSNNVLQHVLSPIDFISELSGHLSQRGLLVVICPNASRPSNEMLWCDQNFSFAPEHLVYLAEKTGLRVASWRPNPAEPNLFDKQLAVLTNDKCAHAPISRPNSPKASSDELFAQRCNYIRSWREMDGYLCAASDGSSRVFNFGASTWTWLLGAYCPEYWRRVTACLVDDCRGECLDKEVRALSDEILVRGDYLVLGINPLAQAQVAQRFQSEPFRTITWDDYVRS